MSTRPLQCRPLGFAAAKVRFCSTIEMFHFARFHRFKSPVFDGESMVQREGGDFSVDLPSRLMATDVDT